MRVYLNDAGVACGRLWVDWESIRLENHSGRGEHIPKATQGARQSGICEVEDQREQERLMCTLECEKPSCVISRKKKILKADTADL